MYHWLPEKLEFAVNIILNITIYNLIIHWDASSFEDFYEDASSFQDFYEDQPSNRTQFWQCVTIFWLQ